MLVWGGAPRDLSQGDFNDGARFAPATSSWSLLPTLATLSARSGHLAVWTGQRMWIWGGADENADMEYARQGILFDPTDAQWTISHASWIPEGRINATAVWTGSQVAIWGGFTRSLPGYFADGALYDPQTDVWTPMSNTDAPVGRYNHVAVWTGNRMLIWGGYGADGAETSGGGYDPVADRWSPISNTGAPSLKNGVAVWPGRAMLVWDGSSGGGYDPVSDTWRPINPEGAPSARGLPTAVWTGTRMIVWGGYLAGAYFQDGAIYDPASDSWTPLPLDGAPSARRGHTAVWTGDRMLIWGGSDASGVMNTGAAFVPSP